MALSRPAYLLDKLIKNTLTKVEMEEFLAGINNSEISQEYSDILEKYFNQLLAENSAKKFCENDLLKKSY